VERLVEPGHVPRFGVRALGRVPRHGARRHLVDPLEHRLFLALPLQDLPAHAVDDLALFVHDVVVLEEVLPDLEVPRLHPLLGGADGPRHHAVLDGLAFLHAQAVHDLLDALRAEDAEEVVLEGEIEARGAGIALAARAAAELIVDAAGLVPLGADDVQAPEADDPLVLGIGEALGFVPGGLAGGRRRGGGIQPLLPHQLLGQEVGVAAEEDVGAPARHVRGDGDGLLAPRLGDDLRLALVILGVEDLMGNAALLEEPREMLGDLDGHRAHQHRLALGVTLGDLVGHRLELLPRRLVDDIRVVHAGECAVGGHHRHVQLVDLGELLRLGGGRAGHPRQLVVHPEVILEGDRRKRLIL
jgi:hypothetical protein